MIWPHGTIRSGSTTPATAFPETCMVRRLFALSLVVGLAACSSDGPTVPVTHTPPSAPTPSLVLSTVTSSAASLVADGASTATITVTLEDSTGRVTLRSGGTITLQATTGSLSTVVDVGNGTYRATFTASTNAGTATIWAWLNGVQLFNRAAISLVGGVMDPARSFMHSADSVVSSDGLSSTAVNVYVRDANGNPTDAGVGHVTMATTLGSLGQIVRGVRGQYFASIKSATNGTAIVTAEIDAHPVPSTAAVRFSGGFWSSRAALPFARQVLATGVIDGTLYAVGGGGWNAASYSGTVTAYDPAIDKWTTKSPMPTARGELAAGVINGILYAVGGYAVTDLNTVEAYDPSSDTWSIKAPMPTAREGLAIGVVNGILYAVGGNVRGQGAVTSYARSAARSFFPAGTLAFNLQSADHVVATVEAYDPVTNTWTTKAPMPTPRSMLAVGVVNGILYAVGGQSATGSFNVVEAYNPATNTWTTKAPMPESYGRSALAIGVLNGMLYAVGGFVVYAETSLVEAYDPVADKWVAVRPMPTMRQSLGAGVINGVLYTVGGACYDDTLTVVEAYIPP